MNDDTETVAQAPASGTKNEVFAAYDELLRKLKDTQKTPTAIKQEEKVIEEKKQVVETAARDTGDKDQLATHLENLKSSLNKSLEDIDEKLKAEHQKFSTLQQAIKIQSKELNDLYEIRPAADTLAALLQAHKEKSFLLDQDILQRRTLWKREQEDFEAKRRERDSQLTADRQRDEELYVYNRDVSRKKDADEHDIVKRNQEQELLAQRQQQDDLFKERESAHNNREREFQFQCETTKRNLEQESIARRTELEEESKVREAKFESMRRNLEEETANRRREMEEESKLREAKLETMRRNFEEANLAKRTELEEENKLRETKFETMRQNFEESHAAKRSEMEAEFKAREERIALRENEFQQMKERTENFPQEILRATQEAERILADTLTQKFQYEAKLLEKDFETERMLHQQNLASQDKVFESERLSHKEALAAREREANAARERQERELEAAREKQAQALAAQEKVFETERQVHQQTLAARDREADAVRERQVQALAAQEKLFDTERLMHKQALQSQEKDFETERQSHKQALVDLENHIKKLESLNYNFKPMAYNPEKASHEV
jgi:hypothetical protein